MGRTTSCGVLNIIARTPLLFLFSFLLIQASFAYDCTKFSEPLRTDCLSLNSIDENLIANLVYTNNSYPDHTFVRKYNDKIVTTIPPNTSTVYNVGVIRNAWSGILCIDPAVQLNNITFVPLSTKYRADYNYTIILPVDYYNNQQSNGQTCKILYSKNAESSSVNWQRDGIAIGVGKNITIINTNYTIVKEQTSISATTKADKYIWQRYCCSYGRRGCSRYCYRCKFSITNYIIDTITINDTKKVQSYIHQPNASFTVISNYTNTYQGILQVDNKTSIKLTINNTEYRQQLYDYTANFSKPQYYFLNIIARYNSRIKSNNLYYNNNTIYVHTIENCSLEASDLFNTTIIPCKINITSTISETTQPTEFTKSLQLLFLILVSGAVLVLIYRLIKHYWGRILIPVVCLLLLIPSVHAADDCGITNLASCIPQKIYDFLLSLLNAPLQPLLELVQKLLSTAPNIDSFQGVWAIIVYCISLFYGLLFMYSGFLFLFSGHDVLRREMAKEWLKNTVIMVVFIQASFYLYGLFLELGSIMSSSVLSMVDPHFFMLTADNIVNIGLQFIFTIAYVFVLIGTVILLTMRYLVVVFGVLFLPIGIFCYFIPPLRSYGRLILNILGMFVFITFIDAIIILGCSMLINIPTFANFKILVMITCFIIINSTFVILIRHITQKSSNGDGVDKLAQAAKYIGTMV